MLLSISKDSFVNCCPVCGSRSTYYLDYGSAKGKPGPFKLSPGMSLKFRFDDENGGPGTIEEVTFQQQDFLNFDSISTDEMVNYLNQHLQGGTAYNDYYGVLILSKTSGLTSCVEVVDGDARLPMGFMMYGHDGLHTCCERPAIGFVNTRNNPKERPGHRSIMMRRCWCGNQEMLLSSQINAPDMNDHTNYDHGHRMGVNRLAKMLHDYGHHDIDSKKFYAKLDRFTGADMHPHCPVATDKPLVLISYEDLKKKLGGNWDYIQKYGRMPSEYDPEDL